MAGSVFPDDEAADGGGLNDQAIPHYRGEKTACDGCGKDFTYGDFMLVDERHDIATCYEDLSERPRERMPMSESPCVFRVVLTGKTFNGRTMMYVG